MSKILFFSSVFPQPGDPTRGTFCANLCTRLGRDHEVRVVSPWPWFRRVRTKRALVRDCVASFAGEGVHAEYPPFLYPPRVLPRAHGELMWRSGRGAFRRACAGRQPDSVLSYWAYPDGWAAIRAARAIGVPVGLIVGGSDVLLIDRHPARDRFLESLNQADLVMPVSRDLARALGGLGVDDRKIHVVYQGVDEERFTPGDRQEARLRLGLSPEGPLLLWVGRMVPVKGLEILLAAAAGLARRGLPFEISLVGDGPLRTSLEARARSLGIDGRVHFVGPRPQAQLPDWYRASDLFVLPSYSEGIPNVLRESLACGRPFVATRVGGVPELHDPSCRLVPAGSAAALADAIESVMGAEVDPAALSGRALTGPGKTWPARSPPCSTRAARQRRWSRVLHEQPRTLSTEEFPNDAHHDTRSHDARGG
ncbi:MAG: glycosyltransferase [Isosphaeraceae bacterium]